jgi:hypothetical protein
MPSVVVNTSTDGADLVPAPPAGQFIRVVGGELSAVSAQSLVTLKSNTTVIWRTVGLNAANSHVEFNVDSNRTIDCTPGEALKIGLAAAANVSGTLEYVIYGKPPSGS